MFTILHSENGVCPRMTTMGSRRGEKGEGKEETEDQKALVNGKAHTPSSIAYSFLRSTHHTI